MGDMLDAGYKSFLFESYVGWSAILQAFKSQILNLRDM